jgi:hypothetical protein
MNEAKFDVSLINEPLQLWPPKPKLVWDRGRIVGDALVICSPRDPNWFRNHRHDGVIEVRREPMTVRAWLDWLDGIGVDWAS